MLHRSFWSDIPLCLSDRYASYLGHLQYRLYRSPSTSLVMHLLQVQEELNIIIQIMEQQMELIKKLQVALKSGRDRTYSSNSAREYHQQNATSTIPTSDFATYRQMSFSHLSDPSAQLLENLQREYVDLCDLRDNANTLINRTIQLVNIRLEDHGKAILVFTIITIIFLPLSFVSSFFGMNFADIRDMERTQGLFWIIAGSLTVGTMAFALFVAFYGSSVVDWFIVFKEDRRRKKRSKKPALRETARGIRASGSKNFEVLDVKRPRLSSMF